MLRTNLQAGTAEELWSQCMQLTEAEASFRTLKSELYIRPLFHQLEPRVKAHVLVAFLGTHCGSRSSSCLSAALQSSRSHRPASSQPSTSVGNEGARVLSTMQSADIVLPTTDGFENPPTPHHRTHRRAEGATPATGLQPPPSGSN